MTSYYAPLLILLTDNAIERLPFFQHTQLVTSTLFNGIKTLLQVIYLCVHFAVSCLQLGVHQLLRFNITFNRVVIGNPIFTKPQGVLQPTKQ
ncbi:hypothetical protein [Vibrio vulnificus YJ016]|uniref:Uncharacterized protein n=1 Tax=Vibrio vulnificus (strain YJ016) TaxID=196600 RepID=Q7MHQ3_VIBVY|nr:hypothetical protein [Vibrio vulnificus YJ016]